MSQSTVITAAVFFLFLVYITAKGRLPQYLATLFGPVTVTGGGSGPGVSSVTGGQLVSSSVSSANTGSASGLSGTLSSQQAGSGQIATTAEVPNAMPLDFTGGLY